MMADDQPTGNRPIEAAALSTVAASTPFAACADLSCGNHLADQALRGTACNLRMLGQ